MERNYNIDTMKCFCIIAVVCIHTCPFAEKSLGLIINVISRVAVPLFFISSGYLFYSKFSEKYTKRYFIKILKIYISWTLFYIVMSLVLMSLFNILNGLNVLNGYKEYFSNFNLLNIYYSSGIIRYHLWYLSTMLLVIPILYFVIKKNLLKKALLVTSVLNVIGIFIYNLDIGYLVHTRDVIFFGSFYSILGSYIKCNEEHIKNKVKIINKYYVSLIFMFMITSYIERLIYDNYFIRTGDCYISTIFLSILIFILCIIKINNKDSFFSKIGRNSLGIYVIHPAIIDIIDVALFILGLQGITTTIIWQIIYTPIIITLSYYSYKLLQIMKAKIFLSKPKIEKEVV